MTIKEILEGMSSGDKLVVTVTDKVWLMPLVSVTKSPNNENRWNVAMGKEGVKTVNVLLDIKTLVGLFTKQTPVEIKLLTAASKELTN